MREQPFSVILLDEFEKAYPTFFDLLLQALGEGRLTDAAGRVADFSNAIVVMTSNLGAESFGRALSASPAVMTKQRKATTAPDLISPMPSAHFSVPNCSTGSIGSFPSFLWMRRASG